MNLIERFSYPEMCDDIDIECSLNGCIIQFKDCLSTDYTSIVDDNCDISNSIFDLEERPLRERRRREIQPHRQLDRYHLDRKDRLSSRVFLLMDIVREFVVLFLHYLVHSHPIELMLHQVLQIVSIFHVQVPNLLFTEEFRCFYSLH